MHGIHAWLRRFTQVGGLDTFEVLVVSCARCNQSDEDIKVVALVAESLFILSVVPLLSLLFSTCPFVYSFSAKLNPSQYMPKLCTGSEIDPASITASSDTDMNVNFRMLCISSQNVGFKVSQAVQHQGQ